jgi:SAM-dependent methyltransferase
MNKREFYNIKQAEYSHQDFEAELRYNRAIGLAELITGTNVLDVGCKYALLKHLIEKQGISIDYYGVDISDRVFKDIKGITKSNFIVSDVSRNLPFPNDTFNFIFALEIMEHVENPTNMIYEINRVLKKDGAAVISVPNIYAWNEILANIKKMPDSEGHISSFTYQNLERILNFADMKIDKYCGTYCRIPFSKRFLKTNYHLFKTNALFLSRSYIYKIVKSS